MGVHMIEWLVDLASQALDPEEREAVRGDLSESGTNPGRALRDVLGLVIRRQAAQWTTWRGWLVLIAVVFPGAMMLSLFCLSEARGSSIYAWMYVNNWTWGYLAPGFRGDLAKYLVATLLEYAVLGCWAWTAGFVVGLVSRRTILINGPLFCLVLLLGELAMPPADRFGPNGAVFLLPSYRIVFPLIVLSVVAILPSAWGMRHGATLTGIPRLLRAILWIVTFVAALYAVQMGMFWWSHTVPREPPKLPPILRYGAFLPVAYVLTGAIRKWCRSPPGVAIF
jgi:hypothetical protein